MWGLGGSNRASDMRKKNTKKSRGERRMGKQRKERQRAVMIEYGSEANQGESIILAPGGLSQ